MHRDARPPQLGQEVDGSDGRRLLAGIRFHLVAEQHLVGVGAVGQKLQMLENRPFNLFPCEQGNGSQALVMAQLVGQSLPTPEIRGSNPNIGKILFTN